MAQCGQHSTLIIAFILGIAILVSAKKGFNANGEKDNGKRKLKKKTQILHYSFYPIESINLEPVFKHIRKYQVLLYIQLVFICDIAKNDLTHFNMK